MVGDRVAKRIAEGQFDIGFQQISEIKPFTGKYGQVELVGPILRLTKSYRICCWYW